MTVQHYVTLNACACSSTSSNRASPEGKLLQDLDDLKEAHDDPSSSQLLPKKSRLYTSRRLSAAPDVQVQMEAIMREKQAIQEELQTLVERVTVRTLRHA